VKPCDDEIMKPHPEMVEGPEALRRFEDTMKAIFTSRKRDVLPERPKERKPNTPKKPTKPKG
jgi:hypothetical protein